MRRSNEGNGVEHTATDEVLTTVIDVETIATPQQATIPVANLRTRE
jgi:hypothetical protein